MYGVAGSRTSAAQRARQIGFIVLHAMLGAACLGIAMPARAAPAAAHGAARLKARGLYAEGDKALTAGDAQAALTKFEAAYQTLPNALVLLRIADCKARLGDGTGAVQALEHYLADSPGAKDAASVQARIADLKRKPALVTVKSTPSGAAIWIDGSDTFLSTP